MTRTKWVMLCNPEEGSEKKKKKVRKKSNHACLVPMWSQWDEGGGGLCFWGDTWFFSAQTDQHLSGLLESPGEQLRLDSFPELHLRPPCPSLLPSRFVSDLKFSTRLIRATEKFVTLELKILRLNLRCLRVVVVFDHDVSSSFSLYWEVKTSE